MSNIYDDEKFFEAYANMDRSRGATCGSGPSGISLSR